MPPINKLIPFLRWFPVSRYTLRADLIAGITVALVLIPQSMAYAQLAGLPAYYGLYAAFLPGIVAALWGSSRQLATGPVAVVSLLTASALIPLVGSPETLTPEQMVSVYAPLAILLALMVGAFQLLLGLLRLGVVVNFLSHPVIVGFTNAAAIIIGLSQLDKMLGVSKMRSERFMHDIWGVIEQLPAAHLPTLLFGVGAIIMLLVCRRFLPKFPGVLVVVFGSTILSWALGFEFSGGHVVGTIPAGLPPFELPVLNLEMMGILLPSAIVIALVGFMETISIAKAMAAKTRDRIDPNQELIGQGLANLVGSMSSAYPSSGSFSRSAVSFNAGAKSGLAAVFTGLVVLVTLLFLTPLLYHLPQAVLAAVIMMAVIGLINFTAIKHAWQASRHDGIAAIITFVATLGFAPHLDQGIMLGAGLALVLYLYRTMTPQVTLLRCYRDGKLREIETSSDAPVDDRVVALRFDGSLYFANISYFEDAMLGAETDNPRAQYILVVCDGINQLDASGEEVLHHLVERLAENEITLIFSGLTRQVQQVMENTGLFAVIGAQHLFPNEQMALEAIYRWLDGEVAEDSFCLVQETGVEEPPTNQA